jgi:hypothetical protein
MMAFRRMVAETVHSGIVRSACKLKVQAFNEMRHRSTRRLVTTLIVPIRLAAVRTTDSNSACAFEICVESACRLEALSLTDLVPATDE